jgi:hypothetical protein
MLLPCTLAIIATAAARRAAAKNHAHVTVVVDPSDYQPLLDKLASGEDMEGFRKQLAWKAFQVGRACLAWCLVPGGLAAATCAARCSSVVPAVEGGWAGLAMVRCAGATVL